MKLSRNAPCWCGSGKKYKRCHLNREQQSPVSRSEVISHQKKLLGWRTCLHPRASQVNCAGTIARSHTVSRSHLRAIQRDGHVYQITADLETLDRTGGRPKAKLVGVNKASAFTAFCARHDAELFEPLEQGPFEATPQQCFLLAYRALAREVYLERRPLQTLEFLRQGDKGRPLEQQLALQANLDSYGLGMSLGSEDVEKSKKGYDADLLEGSFASIRYLVIKLSRPPDFMCSGATQPDYDFQGHQVQDLSDRTRRADFMTLSLIPSGVDGAAVFAWRADSDGACVPFIRSLRSLGVELVPHAIVRFALASFENVFIAPDWWESLSVNDQAAIETHALTQSSLDIPPEPNYLLDNGARLVSWAVTGIATNVESISG